MSKRTILIFTLLLLSGAGLFAQSPVTVTGTVTDASDGQPLPGVAVMVRGTTDGVVTDVDGRYSINTDENSVLVFSFVGMKTQEIQARAGVIDVALSDDLDVLDEVVITGLGISRERKALGYSVQNVKGEELTKVTQYNVANALSGKVAGVQITQAGGALGASQSITIRGNSSFGSNEPLIVIDGVPMDNSAGGQYGGDGNGWLDTGSGLGDINPEDIESISVLKGGSAAIYGMRAGNGVILITTKKGADAKGRVTVSYDGGLTVDNVYNLPRYQNSYGQGYMGHEYAYGLYGEEEGINSYEDWATQVGYYWVDGAGSGVNDGDDESWGPRLDIGLNIPQFNSPIVGGTRQATPWVSHPDNIKSFFRTAISQSHTVSLANATDRGSYRASIGYRGQNGVVPNTDLQHFNVSLSGSHKIGRMFRADLNLNYNKTKSGNLMATGYTSDNPLQSIMQWFGRQVDMSSLKEHWNEKDADGNWYNWINAFHVNPYFNLYNNTSSYDRNRVIAKGSVFLQPVEWFTLEGRAGYDVYSDNTFQKVLYSTDCPSGWFRNTDENREELNADIIAHFDKTWDSFSLNAIAGANYRDLQWRQAYEGASASYGLTIPGIYTMSNVKGTPETGLDHSHIRSNSVYANVSLGWRGQLYLEGSVRNDWSSTINESIFYPSVSAGWLISESFPSMKGDALNLLKVRLNWANVGNATSAYRTKSYMVSVGTNIGGNTQYSLPTTLANSNLKPELIDTKEVGIEAALWNSRIRLDVAAYMKQTSNQIMQIQVPASSGYQYKYINAGRVDNKGLEISLSADLISHRDGFNWTTALNWSKDVSEVKELADGLDTYTLGSDWSCYNYAIVGRSWGTLVGTGLVYDDAGNIIVGDDGLPLSKASQKIGDVTPNWLAGWNNEFSYKGFSLGFLLDFRAGGDFFSVSQMFGSYTGLYDYTADGGIRENGMIAGVDVMKDRTFVKEDGTPNDIRVDPNDFFTSFYSIKELAVVDGSFLKLREAHFTYALPQRVINRCKALKGAKFSIVGNNLAILWLARNNYAHIDPESTLGTGNSSVGYEANACPPTRSIGFKVNLTF